MSDHSIRLAYRSWGLRGGNVAPDDIEGVDYLFLSGPILAPGEKLDSIEQPEAIFNEAFAQLAPKLYLDSGLHVVADVGGSDSVLAANQIAHQLIDSGNATLPVGVVRGYRVLDRLEEFMASGAGMINAEYEQPFSELRKPVVAAVLKLDHEPIVAALNQSARVVLLGDVSLENFANAALSRAFAVTPIAKKSETAALLMQDEWRCENQVLECHEDGRHVRLRESSQPEKSDTPAVNHVPPEGHTELSIIYRNAFVGMALLEITGKKNVNGIDTLFDSLQCALDEEGLPSSGIDYQAMHSRVKQELEIVHFRYSHEERGIVDQVLQLFRRKCCRSSEKITFSHVSPPQVFPVYKTWFTSIPSDLVEWSVDVRPARDWVD